MINGRRLKQLREAKNLTQEEFAARLEVNRSMVAKYEANQSMGLETLLRICKELDTTPDYLLGFKDSNNATELQNQSQDRYLISVLTEQVKMSQDEIKRLRKQGSH